MNILDAYITKAPSPQNILDIFSGEWSSRLPASNNLVTAPGHAALFEDPRIDWAASILGGFTGKICLELGPLEGGHSYMMQKMGAKKIIAIEANSRAFLKCLCIKEIFELDKVEFKLGDFMLFLGNDESRYDLVLASGVLYHMEEPIELLRLISRVSDKVFLWTHYYDENIISRRSDLARKFSGVSSLEYGGVTYEYSTQSYKNALNWLGFCGGPNTVSKWMTRESIIKALEQFGFTDIKIGFEQLNHQNGPSFAICAKKI
jgi:hypothetical protein